MDEPLLLAVDAVTVPVPDLDAGLDFYHGRLGHELRWRNDEIGQAGLAIAGSPTEIVLTTAHGYEPNWLVRSADEAAAAFEAAGGRTLVPPADIPVGRLAVVADPFGNVLVLLDLSAGTYRTDEDGAVTGVHRGPDDPVPDVREATADDPGSMAAVHVAAWQHAYRGIMPDDYLDSIDPAERAAFWAGAIAAGDRRRHILVAEVDGRVVAFACAGPANHDPAVGQLYSLNVDPAHWRTGCGRALLRTAVTRLRRHGFTEAVLMVAIDNARARAFYEAAGWRHDGTELTEDVLGATVRECRYRRVLDAPALPDRLTGDLVELRPLTPDDAPALVASASDPEVWQGKLVPRPVDELQVRDLIAAVMTGPSRWPFAIVRRADQRVIGSTTLGRFDWDHGSVEMGFTWLERAAWGQGFNEDAKRTLLRHCFDDLGLHRVEWQVDTANLRSIAALRRLGFHEEGTLRSRHVRPDGTRRDSMVFSLLVDEWPACATRLGDLVAERSAPQR